VKPYYQDDYATIYHCDCRDILPELPKVDLVLTDPPYGKVKGEFDERWTNRPAMLESCAEWLDAMVSVMKPNATLYWFAWPSLAGRIEALIAQKLNPLAHIIWKKPSAVALKASAASLRAPMPETERIIMAEHYGADNMALGESGYVAKCDELRGFIFEPIRLYLDDERQRSGLTVRQIAEAYQQKTGSRTVTGMAGRWFGVVQWALPTEENYAWLRDLLNRRGGEYLRKDYEDLRKDYEYLRRFFDLHAGDQKTDIWEFNSCRERLGHPTPKPLDMMSFIVRISCRPGGLVVDPFMGSGTTLRAAKDLGRRAIGIELDERYCEIAANRMRQEVLPLFD
jgi:site-specific DNA-methyltransferase (adenine-specific)